MCVPVWVDVKKDAHAARQHQFRWVVREKVWSIRERDIATYDTMFVHVSDDERALF